MKFCILASVSLWTLLIIELRVFLGRLHIGGGGGGGGQSVNGGD